MCSARANGDLSDCRLSSTGAGSAQPTSLHFLLPRREGWNRLCRSRISMSRAKYFSETHEAEYATGRAEIQPLTPRVASVNPKVLVVSASHPRTAEGSQHSSARRNLEWRIHVTNPEQIFKFVLTRRFGNKMHPGHKPQTRLCQSTMAPPPGTCPGGPAFLNHCCWFEEDIMAAAQKVAPIQPPNTMSSSTCR